MPVDSVGNGTFALCVFTLLDQHVGMVERFLQALDGDSWHQTCQSPRPAHSRNLDVCFSQYVAKVRLQFSGVSATCATGIRMPEWMLAKMP